MYEVLKEDKMRTTVEGVPADLHPEWKCGHCGKEYGNLTEHKQAPNLCRDCAAPATVEQPGFLEEVVQTVESVVESVVAEAEKAKEGEIALEPPIIEVMQSPVALDGPAQSQVETAPMTAEEEAAKLLGGLGDA